MSVDLKPTELREENFKVLIVDDDPSILGLLKELISMVPGCDVYTAGRPDEAMQIIAKDKVDVIFTDIHMPGVTGLEMLEDIFSLDQIPEVVVMTAYPSGEIAQKAMELGVNCLLAKPFEDISLVEIELGKAIKRILRKKPAPPAPVSAPSTSEKKIDEDQDASLRLSLNEGNDSKLDVLEDPNLESPKLETKKLEAPKLPIPSSSASKPLASREEKGASVAYSAPENAPVLASIEGIESGLAPLFSGELLEPFVAVEIARSRRYKRQFAFGLIDIPENLQLKKIQERKEFRQQKLMQLRKNFRSSDILFDLGKEGVAFLACECNKAGAQVVTYKLGQAGFDFVGCSIFPAEGQSLEALMESVRKDLQEKRKQRILILESEEFFGRIVHNMLSDPKYHITWAKSNEEAYPFIEQQAENLKLMIISLKKDKDQWALLSRIKKENLIHWPILLFTEVPLDAKLRDKLHKLGIKGIVKKGASQEEFLYVVQSFVMHNTVQLMRKNPRALATLPAVYRYQGREISSNTFTLSRDGAFVRDLNPPAAGERLALQIYIPGRKEALECEAEVLYSVPYFVGVNRIHVPGMAVRFVSLQEADVQYLDRFVEEAMTGYLIGEGSEPGES
jgi:CheY-like chemotaxis protein